jgi:hypothetical protein
LALSVRGTRGKAYRLFGTRTHVSAKGFPGIITIWTTDCRECGVEFTVEAGLTIDPRKFGTACLACRGAKAASRSATPA